MSFLNTYILCTTYTKPVIPNPLTATVPHVCLRFFYENLNGGKQIYKFCSTTVGHYSRKVLNHKTN